MYKQKIVKVPIYHGYICIIHTDEPEIPNKKYGLLLEENFYATTVDWKIKRNGVFYTCRFITFNPNSPHGKITEGCIAHEALHAAHMILKHKGCIPDFDNDEPLAYLLEWIVQEINKFKI